MAGTLAGRVALVTGAGSGIGRASALAFVAEGAKVAVADIDVAGGEKTVRIIKDKGGDAIFIKTDVTLATEVEALVQQVVATYGRLDCAHNNAGITGPSVLIADCPEENWDNVISVNLKGVWLCLKYEIPAMLKTGGGAIVNTASVQGLVGSQFGLGAYAASKHGVVGLTKAAALEYAKAGIRVNAICPGTIRSPMTERLFLHDPAREAQMIAREPIGRLGVPEDIAPAVVWLCSDAASFVTGHAMVVDGGIVAQ